MNVQNVIERIAVDSSLSPSLINQYDCLDFDDKNLKQIITDCIRQINSCTDLIKKQPHHLEWKTNLAHQYVTLAFIAQKLSKEADFESSIRLDKKKHNCLQAAKNINRMIFQVDPLYAGYYHIRALIGSIENNIYEQPEQMLQYILVLRTAAALSPSNLSIKHSIQKTETYLNQSPIDVHFQITLDNILKKDPLHELFIENPILFRYVTKDKHSPLLKRYPELESIESFKAKYPNEVFIVLKGLDILSLKNLLENYKKQFVIECCSIFDCGIPLSLETIETLLENMCTYLDYKKQLILILSEIKNAEMIQKHFTSLQVYLKNIDLKFEKIKGDDSVTYFHRLYLKHAN